MLDGDLDSVTWICKFKTPKPQLAQVRMIKSETHLQATEKTLKKTLGMKMDTSQYSLVLITFEILAAERLPINEV